MKPGAHGLRLEPSAGFLGADGPCPYQLPEAIGGAVEGGLLVAIRRRAYTLYLLRQYLYRVARSLLGWLG